MFSPPVVVHLAAKVCTPTAFVLLLHHAVNHAQALESHRVQVSSLMLRICGNYVAGHTNSECSGWYMYMNKMDT
jgi:hypothetical protein